MTGKEYDKMVVDCSAFMPNKDDAHQCAKCSRNIGCGSLGGNLPCGQQHCWVLAHASVQEIEQVFSSN